MEFKQGATVFTSDLRKVGTIYRVVIDPETKEVTHLVIRKGNLFVEDKVLPVDLVMSATEDRVVLRSDIGDLQTLPRFEETHYIPLTEVDPDTIRLSDSAAALYWYPPLGFATWSYAPLAPFYVEYTERNIPENTVPLKVGSKVISRDGKHLGNLEEIFTDPKTRRVTHFLISKGLLLKERKFVPVRWISSVTEDEVHLKVESRLLERLPDYHRDSDQAPAFTS